MSNVNHPKHYNSHPSGIEVIEIVRWMEFDTGNSFKYVSREDHKGNSVQDLEKAIFYVDDYWKMRVDNPDYTLRWYPNRVRELVWEFVRMETNPTKAAVYFALYMAQISLNFEVMLSNARKGLETLLAEARKEAGSNDEG